MEFQLATNRASLPRVGLGLPGSGFTKLVTEILSKNAVLPGLTYFYCNSVSQGGNVVSQVASRNGVGGGATHLRRSPSASLGGFGKTGQAFSKSAWSGATPAA